MLDSSWWYKETFIFLSITFEEGSTRNDTGVSAHGKVVGEEHDDGGDVEDDHQGWCCDPVILGNKDGEGDEDGE